MPILYADEHLLVVNKPAGLLVHRSRLDAQEEDNLLDRLRWQLQAQPLEFPAAGGDPLWLAPAHRLDKGTSGVLVLCRHAQAASVLGQAWREGRVEKTYWALVRGWPADDFWVDYPLARDPELPSSGQAHFPAATRFLCLGRVEWPFQVDPRFSASRYAWLAACPQEGRRHQIRRHLKQAAHPLVGDATYGKGAHNRAVAAWLGRQRLWLHARELRLAHPHDGRLMHWQAPAGEDWSALLQPLRAQSPWRFTRAGLDALATCGQSACSENAGLNTLPTC